MLVNLHRIDTNFGCSMWKVFLLATGTEEDCFYVDFFDYCPEQSASIILSLPTEDTHRYIPMYTLHILKGHMNPFTTQGYSELTKMKSHFKFQRTSEGIPFWDFQSLLKGYRVTTFWSSSAEEMIIRCMVSMTCNSWLLRHRLPSASENIKSSIWASPQQWEVSHLVEPPTTDPLLLKGAWPDCGFFRHRTFLPLPAAPSVPPFFAFIFLLKSPIPKMSAPPEKW